MNKDCNCRISSKARTIGRYLGDEYEITASVGHIRDLPQSTIGVDVKMTFFPLYNNAEKIKSSKKSKTTENAEQIYIATDPDREGGNCLYITTF